MSTILSQIGVQIVVGLVGVVWTAFKSLDFMKSRKAERYSQAVEMLEAGVEKTYQECVKGWKSAADDGKLSEQEQRVALGRAIRTATVYAKDRGIDLVETLGREYLPVLVTHLVRGLKGKKAVQNGG